MIGAFQPVFDPSQGTAHLALLHLDCADAFPVVQLVRDCCAAPSTRHDILSLLAEANWRPALVATVASLFVPLDAEIITRLWHHLDTGNWVVPQIAVVLARLDPEFASQCRRRLEAHCPLDSSVLRAMTPLERHSAAGPADEAARSAKAAAALAWLAGLISPAPPWLQPLLDSPGHQTLISHDEDGSRHITERWHERIGLILDDLPAPITS
ncbi:MAG: hypothetical protein ACO1TE_17525 [Prosthecobacter sp.]